MFSFAVGVNALSDNALEPEYAATKKKLIDTDVYQNESRYRKLYERSQEILGRIFSRHAHLALNVEGKYDDVDRTLLFNRSGSDLRASGLKLSSTEDELILYAALFSYIGGFAKRVGTVEVDPEFALRAANYLIEERDFELGRFFKGFMLKYGLKPYSLPDLDHAKALLEHSAKCGIGAAQWELKNFDRYRREFDGVVPTTRHIDV